MSDMTTVPAIAADQNIQGEAANAVDDTNNHTPVPAPVPVVEHVPDQATPAPPEGMKELTELVTSLANSVATLETAVLGLVDKDERPQGVPWTHAGMRRDND